MVHFLKNLLGETPYLFVLASIYIIMDRVMFGNRLSRIILDGWTAALRRLWNRIRRRLRVPKILPLRPADPSKILDTVAWDGGLEGHDGEVSPKQRSNGNSDYSFAPASGEKRRDDGIVSEKDFDKVFTHSRCEVVRKRNDNEEWLYPDLHTETDLGNTYGGPDEDARAEEEYDEMNAVYGLTAGRDQTPQERDLAQRAIRNMKGTPEYRELEKNAEQMIAKIRTVVVKVFADAAPKRPGRRRVKKSDE